MRAALLSPQFFLDLTVSARGEIQITDALLTQAKQGKVIAFKFKGKRFDCGGIKGFVAATNYFAEQQGFFKP